MAARDLPNGDITSSIFCDLGEVPLCFDWEGFVLFDKSASNHQDLKPGLSTTLRPTRHAELHQNYTYLSRNQ